MIILSTVGKGANPITDPLLLSVYLLHPASPLAAVNAAAATFKELLLSPLTPAKYRVLKGTEMARFNQRPLASRHRGSEGNTLKISTESKGEIN